ncbi:DUF3427 domain-containing protein [Streptomyces sp. NPDC050732]|uniref:DUF3427 domain-containing protein n=1 Tax=Streptomyces sp. NPDC050732 TaxID=3154632 RepID=UPI00342E4D1C
MTEALGPNEATSGLYEQLVALRIEDQLKGLDAASLPTINGLSGSSSTPRDVAWRVAEAIRSTLQQLPEQERLHTAHSILESVATLDGVREWVNRLAAERGVIAYPHQKDMLERLAVERSVRGRHRNLLVAATGTGKTVMAALDYQELCREAGRSLRLLFVAHRKEILEQSRQTYQRVLNDAAFGESFHSGGSPQKWTHVFASVQSLNPQVLDGLPPDHFDVIVIDEFHHSTSPTYRKIIDHFTPRELLGLTATPERMDGKNVQDEFFDGNIAAEMRLWEALENELLSSFRYFGISDDTDLRSVEWKRGTYDLASLSDIFTQSSERAQLVVEAVKEKVPDLGSMRALGFCVSVSHAQFMAHYFREAGIKATALSGASHRDERQDTLSDLKAGKIQVIFSVDLFNEGLDIPDVDTLLLLRPTASATLFLQQLGRGLRRTEQKEFLTVLDFIGQHRKEFHFENQFRALTNLTRKRLLDNLEHDFPSMPSSCQIILEPKAKQAIIKNIKEQLNVNANTLAREVREYGEPHLSTYLTESGRDIKEIYRGGNGNSWTTLLRRAKMLPEAAPDGELGLLKRISSFLHVDDRDRIEAYQRLLADNAPVYDVMSPLEQSFARMLFFNFWDNAGGYSSYQEGLASLQEHEAVRDELHQVLEHCLAHTDHYPIRLEGPHSSLPLNIHSSYNRSEILAALNVARLGGQMPRSFAQGVVEAKEFNTDALLITLEKDDKDFTPTIRYKDYAMSPTLFHWESQNATDENSATGRRYREHTQRGSHILLFVRRYKSTDIGGAEPWMFLGPAQYVSHEGSKPMAITWKLQHEVPADVWTYSSVTT